jgi:hypothetical protein
MKIVLGFSVQRNWHAPLQGVQNKAFISVRVNLKARNSLSEEPETQTSFSCD